MPNQERFSTRSILFHSSRSHVIIILYLLLIDFLVKLCIPFRWHGELWCHILLLSIDEPCIILICPPHSILLRLCPLLPGLEKSTLLRLNQLLFSLLFLPLGEIDFLFLLDCSPCCSSIFHRFWIIKQFP